MKEENIIRFGDFPSALAALSASVRSKSFSFDRYTVVLTPDRFTLNAEKALFAGGGSLNCEVLTFSRLTHRLAAGGKTLSREGGVMLTARAIAAVADKLTYYRRAVGFYEFAREIYDTFLQIGSSDLDVCELEADGALREKLDDLALIRAEYDRLKGEDCDSTDRLTALIDAIGNSEFIAGADVCAIGYALGVGNTTRLNRRVFDALEGRARTFTYYDALPPRTKRDSICVLRAPDRITQYKEVAARIRRYVYDGGRYGDVSVISPSPRTLGRILREYKIEAYTDEAIALADTPPLSALRALYGLRERSDADVLVGLCKNPFSGCDERDAAELQRAVAASGVSYGVFDKKFEGGAERAVKRIKTLMAAMTGSFAEAVGNLIAVGGFERIQSALYADGTDMIGPTLSLAGLLKKYGSGDFDVDAASFFSSAEAVEVKSLPRKQDRVTVTVPQTLRLTACKLLIVTDFNEGVLPAITADSGLLSDAELSGIASGKGRIEPTVREQNRRARAELKAVINNAERVICTYSTSGGGRRAVFLNELARSATEEDISELAATLRLTDDPELIADSACVPSAARELAARGATSHTAALIEAAGQSDMSAAPFGDVIALPQRRTISVSELSHWFKCPYRRFLSDAVGVTERKAGVMSAPDFGIVVHEFMRRFIQSPPYDTSRQAVESIVDGVLSDMEIELDANTRRRLTEDAADYAASNVAVLEAGDYTPALTEHRFGGELSLGRAGVDLVGVIDRVDTCGPRARIMDYKTGTKSFSVADCLNGQDMQLPLYAAVMRKDFDVTGMFYLPLSPRYEGRTESKLMLGKLVKDVDVALEYDRSLTSCETSDLFSVRFKYEAKNAKYDFNNRNKGAIPREEFEALIDRCVRNAELAADEIAEGYIARSPADGACERCPYFGICGERKRVRFTGAAEDEA